MKYLVALVLIIGIVFLSWHCCQEHKVTELQQHLNNAGKVERLAKLATTNESVKKRYAKRIVKETFEQSIIAQKVMGKINTKRECEKIDQGIESGNIIKKLEYLQKIKKNLEELK